MNDQSRPKGPWATWLLVALALFCAQRAHASDPAALPSEPNPAPLACTPAPEPAAAEPIAGGAGMLAFIDPQTGKLTSTPSAEQREALRQLLASQIDDSTAGLVAVRHADGRLSMDLQGHFMNFAMVTLAPSGQASFACTNRLGDAVKFMTTPAIPTLNGLETE